MAARFAALDELLDEALELPVGEKVYRIPSPPAEDGLRIERITTLAARIVAGGADPETEALDDQEELDLYRLCLGPVYDELREDGVSWAVFRHVALTAMFWITADRETAEAYWSSGGDPSRVAPNRAARRRQGSSGSAAGSTTRSRGSTSGTKAASRRATRPAA